MAFRSGPECGGASIVLESTIKDAANLQGADMKVAVKAENAVGIAGLLGEQVALQGPLAMTCRLTDARPSVYRIAELQVAMGGSDLEGSLGIDITGPRPVFSADLRSRRFDLRPLTKEKKAGSTSTKSRPARDRVFPDSPLALGAAPAR